MEQMGTDARLVVREISKPLYQSKGWMQFLGILSIINGAVLVFTLFGILIAWLPIWIGVLLLQAASSVERATTTGDKQAIVASLGKLKTYFAIQGVMTLIGIIVAIIAIAFGLMSAIMNSVF
jgi:hypothetical protein